MTETNNKPTILIVEDGESYQNRYARELADHANILAAYNIHDAERLFEENKGNISLIVMDACVPGDSPTTLGLTREFKKTFEMPMIAASSISDYRQDLLLAGCTHEASKYDVSKLVVQLLAKQREQQEAAAGTPPATKMDDVSAEAAIESPKQQGKA